jgi:hypothetical protein
LGLSLGLGLSLDSGGSLRAHSLHLHEVGHLLLIKMEHLSVVRILHEGWVCLDCGGSLVVHHEALHSSSVWVGSSNGSILALLSSSGLGVGGECHLLLLLLSKYGSLVLLHGLLLSLKVLRRIGLLLDNLVTVCFRTLLQSARLLCWIHREARHY